MASYELLQAIIVFKIGCQISTCLFLDGIDTDVFIAITHNVHYVKDRTFRECCICLSHGR